MCGTVRTVVGNGTKGVCMAWAFAGVRVLVDTEGGLGAALTRETATRNGARDAMDACGQQQPKKGGICWCGGQCGRCGWSDTRWPIVGGCGKTGFALRGGPRAAELAHAARVERRSDATEPLAAVSGATLP